MLVVVLLVAFTTCVIAQGFLHLNEGEICKDTSPPWYCRQHFDCPGLKEAIKRREFPKICSFKGRAAVVCCQSSDAEGRPPPISTSASWTPTGGTTNIQDPTVGLKAERKCKEYEQYVWKKIKSPVFLPGEVAEEEKISFCGRVVQPLIVGGEDARPREFPHMALIGYGDKSRIQWLCGGSLISERFILSAAHCTKPGPKREASWANLGDLNVSTDLDEAEPVTLKIIERINHPGYTEKELYHDIALYKLERDAPLGIYIRPICLNTKRIVPQPKALASGWGHTAWGGHGSAMLQKVELDLVSNKRCNSSYHANIGKDLELPQGIIADYMICAGGVGGKDTCQGDSGGPLQIPLQTPYCMYAIIGVTSFGKGCATNTPGVYTNVAHYVKWIEDIVWPT